MSTWALGGDESGALILVFCGHATLYFSLRALGSRNRSVQTCRGASRRRPGPEIARQRASRRRPGPEIAPCKPAEGPPVGALCVLLAPKAALEAPRGASGGLGSRPLRRS